jgi:hypothetical protein
MQSDVVGNYSVTEFAEGFVHGLQKYENQTSKCSSDVTKIQAIVNDLKDIIEAIQAGKFDTTKIMLFFYNAWSTLNTIEDSCHFYKLLLELKDLILNPVSLITKIVWVVFVGSWTIIPCSFRILIGLIWGDSYSAGLNLGRIFKVVFDYEIE